MDVEWAIDGLTNELFIVQARPKTIHSISQQDSLLDYDMAEKDLDCATSVKMALNFHFFK